MDNLIVCTRALAVEGGLITRISRAGVAVRAANGFVHTYVLDNRDPHIALLMDRQQDVDMTSSVFHVFVGRFLERLGATEYEVFRFHGDVWLTSLEADEIPFGYGVEVHREVQGNRVLRHGYERLGGLVLADAQHVSALLLANAPVPRMPADLIPDRLLYRARMPWLPHPGMATDEVSGLEQYLRLSREPEPVRVM